MAAIPAIRTMTGSIDLAHDPLPLQMSIAYLSCRAVNLFYNANKLMPGHSPKAHIALDNLQIRIANAGQHNPDQRLSLDRRRHGIVTLQRQTSFSIDQCAHNISSYSGLSFYIS